MRKKSIAEKRIDSVLSDLRYTESRMESRLSDVRRKVKGLRTILNRHEKKTSMTYDEVIHLEPAYHGDVDAVFLGKKKFRCDDGDGSFEFEIHSNGIKVSCSNQYTSALFHLNREVLEKFQEWIREK